MDTIHLGPLDADSTDGGNQAFTFIGNGLFSHTPGELNFRNHVVSGDTDGDGAADFQILLAGVSSIIESDFIL